MREVELSRLTTLGVGGKACVFVAETPKDLCSLADLTVLGGGSNILAGNRNLPDFVLNKTSGIEYFDDGIYASSGERISKLCMCAKLAGLSGLEWAWGLPGTLGGAVKGNAGAINRCMADIVDYVDVFIQGKSVRVSNNECGFFYRNSRFDKNTVILGAKLLLKRADSQEIEKRMMCAREKRLTQPKGKSAGCVFKNKDGLIAGKIIDECGLKNKRIGGAKISDKHANFIINFANAHAEDVYELILFAENEVKRQTGVLLEREIKIFGEF